MKKLYLILALLIVAAALGGCSLLGIGGQEPETEPSSIINGTTTGNIINYGFGVQYGDELIFTYTGEGVYPVGSIVRSNPETGQNSMVLEEGGLYMSIVGDTLYYCTPQGVYKTALVDPRPSLVLDKNVAQLQIANDNMFYIEDGAIDSSTIDGDPRGFSRIENASWLNVYEQNLYYVNTQDGYIYSANTDGTDAKVFLEQSVSMLQIDNGNAYFIDSVTGYIHSIPSGTKEVQTVVEFACSGFNVNSNNLYYTRNINGIGTCCLSRPNGSDEEILSDFGDSDWHIVSMWNDGAIIVRIEDLPGL
ncbi:MAG: DUF5050 domain-containing protein [Clostridia bacterium]|nr:DUF5050 domain-containing protein [Clostridia bacterium]MBT7123264.1 DUF5050 domain-containing protein [Clostridia bacterium]